MNFQTKLLLLTVCQLFITDGTSPSRSQHSRCDQQSLPRTFGSAQGFYPIYGAIVVAHCKWEVVINTVINRIPQTISEIMCQNPTEVCGGNSAYRCRQVRSKMLVAYTEGANVVNLRNYTVSVGCSCVRRTSNVVQSYNSQSIHQVFL